MNKRLAEKAFEEGLYKHLRKCEIEFIAKHKKDGGFIPDVQNGVVKPGNEIENYLRRLGFRIKERYEVDGGKWIEYAGGLCVSLETGFIITRK